MKFEDLPKVYQDKINADIDDVFSKEYAEIISAFREWEAESLSECEIHPDDEVEEDFQGSLISFVSGWQAKENSSKKEMPAGAHMELEAAIETLARWQAGNYATRIDDMNPAVKLGIEALKSVRQDRVLKLPGRLQPLPGETAE